MATVVEFLLAGFTNNSGEPLASGKVYTYEAGTTTPKAVYTDSAGATPETNPVILDSNGRKQVYAEGTYKFVVKTSADATLYTFDNYNADTVYATTEAELVSLNSANVQIIIKESITLTANRTITAPLRIEKGGVIVTNGYTLTINGPFEAGLYSCFTTAATQVVFGKGSLDKVHPEWFGAVADQSTNCGTAIGIAIASVKTNGGIVWFNLGSYLITTQIALADVSNVVLGGHGTIYLNAEAAEFELSGTCDRLTIDGLTFAGPGTDWTTPNGCFSSASASALAITNLTIKNCVFKDMPFAIHLNANGSGLYENARIENCRFINIVGTASGHGNGLVMAGPSGRFVGGIVIGCTFERCNRHSLYVEAVTSCTIVGCSFREHRADQTTTDSPFYAALNIARSQHVSVIGCVFDTNNDLCVQLYQDDGTGTQNCGPYSVVGCTFRGSTWKDLLIGSDTPDSPIYPLSGVIVANNTFVRNGTNEVSAIYYSSGTEVDIHDNMIYAEDQTDTTALITVFNAGDASGRSGNVKIHDNIIKAATTSGTIRVISLASAVCTGTRVFEIYNNICEIGGSDYDVFEATTVTNLNLRKTLAESSNQASGTYTPTSSALSNLDSATPSLAQYIRVGNVVTVSGKITIDATAGGAASVELTLPNASNVQGAQDVAGIASCGAIMETASIDGVTANDTAKLSWVAVNTSSQSWSYTFTYRVR